MPVPQCDGEGVCKAQLCLKGPARESRRAWPGKMDLVICSFALLLFTWRCSVRCKNLPVHTNAEQMWHKHTHLSLRLSHPSLPTNPSSPSRISASMSDACTCMWLLKNKKIKRQTSRFSSPDFVARTVIHYNAPVSLIPRGSIKRNESEIHPGGFLHAQKHMINVPLGHGSSAGDIAFPLLVDLTKTTTRLRSAYFSTRWQHLWWNFLLIPQDFVATLALGKITGKRVCRHANKQERHPHANSHTSLSLLKLRSLADILIYLYFYLIAVVSCPEIFLILLSSGVADSTACADIQKKQYNKGHCSASIAAS